MLGQSKNPGDFLTYSFSCVSKKVRVELGSTPAMSPSQHFLQESPYAASAM